MGVWTEEVDGFIWDLVEVGLELEGLEESEGIYP
jgi:hypothetical protein